MLASAARSASLALLDEAVEGLASARLQDAIDAAAGRAAEAAADRRSIFRN